MLTLAAGNADSGMWLALGVLAAVVLMVNQLRRRQFRTAPTRDSVREQMIDLREAQGLRGAMDDLLVQIEETARRINAQLDTKFARLEAVIRDADDRLERVRAASQALEALRPTGPSAGVTGPAGDSGRRAPDRATRERPAQGDPAPGPQAQGGARAMEAGAAPRAAVTLPAQTQALHDQVGRLADQGRSAIAIAQETGLPLGEVELILGLRRMR